MKVAAIAPGSRSLALSGRQVGRPRIAASGRRVLVVRADSVDEAVSAITTGVQVRAAPMSLRATKAAAVKCDAAIMMPLSLTDLDVVCLRFPCRLIPGRRFRCKECPRSRADRRRLCQAGAAFFTVRDSVPSTAPVHQERGGLHGALIF